MRTERLLALARMHAYKDIAIVGEFCGKKNRVLKFGFHKAKLVNEILSSAFSPVFLYSTTRYSSTSDLV